jgi:uncharacterized protein YgbK (DUF1537 family)/DNA-binding Lrp family transcriptional regulator
MLLGCIADDFTGATDLAGLMARSGVPVSLRLGVPREPSSASAAIEIVALKCRTSPVEEAVAETLAALKWLRGAGAQRFYWKYCSTFDSTPRGNIGPVAEALMGELGAEQTIYCPAFPENGRFVFMGNLFVGEQPLAESPMKDHPLTPMRDSNLMRLLAPQVTRPVGLVNRTVVARGAGEISSRLAQLAQDGVAHVVVDAVADEDLSLVAEASRDMVLITGGSALAKPLPRIWLREGLLSEAQRTRGVRSGEGPSIILSGSCSAMTNRQVAAYLGAGTAAFRLDPRDLAENGTGAVLEWLSHQSSEQAPIIYATADPVSVRAAQERLGVERAGQLDLEAASEFLAGRPVLIVEIHGHANAERVQRLLDKRIIREITPIFDTRALGYQSMLVAAKVDPEHPWRAAKIINSHPGVSHNYLRDHDFNIWFTIATEPGSRLGLDGTLEVLQRLTGAESVRQLPTLRLFKIRMDLEMEKGTEALAAAAEAVDHKEPEAIELSELDVAVIRATQGPMEPVCSKFFPGVTLNLACRTQSRIVPSLARLSPATCDRASSSAMCLPALPMTSTTSPSLNAASAVGMISARAIDALANAIAPAASANTLIPRFSAAR